MEEGVAVLRQIVAFGVYLSQACNISRWRLVFLLTLLRMDYCVYGDYFPTNDISSYTSAFINVTYIDPVTGKPYSEKGEIGHYGTNIIDSASGLVIHVRDKANKTEACDDLDPSIIPSEPWIALVKRGLCPFQEKVINTAVNSNASAVVVYNNKAESKEELTLMEHDGPEEVMITSGTKVTRVVAVIISKDKGDNIAALVDNNTRVYMYITVGTRTYRYPNMNRTSVLFVSISFIVLMVISLAWLVFYYIQRFRYAHAKDRLAKRLCNAAKKALVKIPLRTLKSGDKEIEADFDSCAVCIEPYKTYDVVRTLPCKHIFHKSCVDPWLLEQRTCPMCKMDILKACGYHVPLISSSQESVVNLELDVGPMRSRIQRSNEESSRPMRTVRSETEDEDNNVGVFQTQMPNQPLPSSDEEDHVEDFEQSTELHCNVRTIVGHLARDELPDKSGSKELLVNVAPSVSTDENQL